MEYLLGLGAAFFVGAIVTWLFSAREFGVLRATLRTLTDTVDQLSASNAELQEKKNHLHNRLVPLEAERDLVTALLLTPGAPAQQRYEGSIVRFHKLEDCGVLTGPNDVPIHFDLAGVTQHTWDVLQTADGRDRNGVVEYHDPIPVHFRLRIAARRGVLLVASDIEVREPYDRVRPPKELPQRPEPLMPGHWVDWRSGGIVEP